MSYFWVKCVCFITYANYHVIVKPISVHTFPAFIIRVLIKYKKVNFKNVFFYINRCLL